MWVHDWKNLGGRRLNIGRGDLWIRIRGVVGGG